MSENKTPGASVARGVLGVLGIAAALAVVVLLVMMPALTRLWEHPSQVGPECDPGPRVDCGDRSFALIWYTDLDARGMSAHGGNPNLVLTRVDFRGADLSRGDLSVSTVVDSDFADVSFVEASLGMVTFRRVDLTGASFVGAGLWDARFLGNTRLGRVDFRNAILARTDFRGADLRGAVFGGGSDISGARVNPRTLDAAGREFFRACLPSGQCPGG